MKTGLTTRSVATKVANSSTGPVMPGLLQRACACGGSPGLSGQCEECRSKKLAGKPLQRKLAINAPGDEYEREADRIAEQVMGMPEPGLAQGMAGSSTFPLVQRRVSNQSAAGVGEAPSVVHEVLASPAQPLRAGTRAFFEPRFGRDFSNVRIHADGKAAESAASVNALAYTVGNHIVLGRAGSQSLAPTRLLAHELVHVQQQSLLGRSANLQRSEGVVTQPEVETDRQGGSADDAEEQRRTYRRITIAWQGTLRDSLRAVARPHAVSSAAADAAVTATIEAVGPQWQIKTPQGTRTGLDEAAMNAAMTMSDKFFIGEGELLNFFAEQLGTSQAELLAADPDQVQGRTIEAEWPLLADPDLASMFMALLDHFTNVKPELVNATDGLTEEEIWALVDQDSQVKVLAGLFTHNYTDFAKSAPMLELDRFLLLEEVIFQQYVWGNPTAVRNLLTPGKGRSDEREGDRFGIIHRDTGQLLYDEGGLPLWTTVGTLLRDPGYRAYKPLLGTGLEKHLDPATEMLVAVVTRNVTDPAVTGAVTAHWIEDPELRTLLGERVLKFVPSQLVESLPAAIEIFAVFAGMHFLAQYLIRLGHPAAVAAGLSLEAALKAIDYFMNVDFGASIATTLMRSGEHLARIRFEDDGSLDALSNRHLDEAAQPIAATLVGLLIQVGASKLGRMFGRAKAGESELHIDGDPARVSETRIDEPAEATAAQRSPLNEERQAGESQAKREEGGDTEAPEQYTARAREQLISKFTLDGETHIVTVVKRGAEFVCELCSGCGDLLNAIDGALQSQPGQSAEAELGQLRTNVDRINSRWQTDTPARRRQNAAALDGQIRRLQYQAQTVIDLLLAQLRTALLRSVGGYLEHTPRSSVITQKGQLFEFGDPRNKHTRVAKATMAQLRAALAPGTPADTLDPDLQELRRELLPDRYRIQLKLGPRSESMRRNYGGQLSSEGFEVYEELVQRAVNGGQKPGGYYIGRADSEIGVDLTGTQTRVYFLQEQSGPDLPHIVPGRPSDQRGRGR